MYAKVENHVPWNILETKINQMIEGKDVISVQVVYGAGTYQIIVLFNN